MPKPKLSEGAALQAEPRILGNEPQKTVAAALASAAAQVAKAAK